MQRSPLGGETFGRLRVRIRGTGAIAGSFKFCENRVLKNGHEPDCVLMFGAHLARINLYFDWVRVFDMIRLLF